MARTHRAGAEHRLTAREAGHSRLSLLSTLAGTVTAYGTFAVVAAIAGSALAAADVETEFRTDDWASSGFVAGLVSAVVLLVAYIFGGYVAGRMARRHGLLHGIAVVVLSLFAAFVVGLIASLGDDAAVQDSLRSIGLPTSWDQIEGVAVFGAVASLVAVVIGGILGGMLGERWHTRLARRVVDPAVGPAAAARADADRLGEHRDERIDADSVLVGERRHGHDDRDVVDVRDRDRSSERVDDRTIVRDGETLPPPAAGPGAVPGSTDRPHYAGHWQPR